MVLFIVGTVSGLVVGLLGGGRLGSLRHHPVRRPLTAFGTVVALAVIRLGWAGEAGALLAVALGAAVAVAVANRHLAGMGVVAVGLAANLVPVVLDGGTPVEPVAWRVAAAVTPDLSSTQHLASARTSVPVLSSRIPLPGGTIVSFGDLVIAVGLAAAAANATRRPRRHGIPVGEILAGGPLTISASHPALPDEPVGGEPIPIPSGWEPADDDAAALIAARLRPRVSLSHPTMRLLHR